MRLAIDEIAVRPEDYQRRRTPFAEQTVEAILAEGYNGAKFDPIPVTEIGGKWTVAGDGHSRLEALKRLRARGDNVPEQVPVRPISDEDARKLADTANCSRTPLSAVEEARIIRRRLDAGERIEDVARSMHRSVTAARSLATLTTLSDSLSALVGKPYGMTVQQAVAFAKAGQRHGWDAATQQQVWLTMKDADLSDRVFSSALEIIGKKLAETRASDDDKLLFAIPRNVKAAVKELEHLYQRITKARSLLRGLASYEDLFENPAIRSALRKPLQQELCNLERRLGESTLKLGDNRPAIKAVLTMKTVSTGVHNESKHRGIA